MNAQCPMTCWLSHGEASTRMISRFGLVVEIVGQVDNIKEQGKQKLEAVSAFLNIFRLLIFQHNISLINYMSIVFSFQHFLTGRQYSIRLKYWANDEPGFMTGPFCSTKILLKT